MNPIIQWLIKEQSLFLKTLPRFLNYYNLRDRIPFYAFLIFLLGRDNKHPILRFLSEVLIVSAFMMGARSIYNIFTNTSNIIFKGFNWTHIIPIQYALIIFAITLIGYSATNNLNYSTALGYNGASAIGYIYETPFWLFSQKYDKAHFLHSSYRFTFFIDYQIISIFVFLWLLKKEKVTLTKKRILLFGIVWLITFFMASRMYLWETRLITRLPIMTYFIFLTLKLPNSRCKQEIVERCRKLANDCEACRRSSIPSMTKEVQT